MSMPQQRRRREGQVAPHFCIFQGDDHGLEGWTLELGCRKNRWDTLLDTALKCQMMDGAWPREVKTSIFSGGDALHMSGAIQPVMMQVVGQRNDGTNMFAPVTNLQWEETLWKHFGEDQAGLNWEMSERTRSASSGSKPGGSKPGRPAQGSGQAALLARLDCFLAQVPRDSVVIVLDYRNVDSTYERLKQRGYKRQPKARNVFLLLGGAHGFDGKNDADDSLYNAILERFRERVGRNRVAKVNLCEEEDNVKFTSVKVAAFLAVEYARGTLRHVVAGAEDLLDSVAFNNKHLGPPKPAPWAKLMPAATNATQAVQKKEVAVQTVPLIENPAAANPKLDDIVVSPDKQGAHETCERLDQNQDSEAVPGADNSCSAGITAEDDGSTRSEASVPMPEAAAALEEGDSEGGSWAGGFSKALGAESLRSAPSAGRPSEPGSSRASSRPASSGPPASVTNAGGNFNSACGGNRAMKQPQSAATGEEAPPKLQWADFEEGEEYPTPTSSAKRNDSDDRLATDVRQQDRSTPAQAERKQGSAVGSRASSKVDAAIRDGPAEKKIEPRPRVMKACKGSSVEAERRESTNNEGASTVASQDRVQDGVSSTMIDDSSPDSLTESAAIGSQTITAEQPAVETPEVHSSSPGSATSSASVPKNSATPAQRKPLKVSASEVAASPRGRELPKRVPSPRARSKAGHADTAESTALPSTVASTELPSKLASAPDHAEEGAAEQEVHAEQAQPAAKKTWGKVDDSDEEDDKKGSEANAAGDRKLPPMVTEVLGGAPVHLAATPVAAPILATASSILQGLCFPRQRRCLLSLQSDLDRLLASPCGSELRFHSMTPQEAALAQFLCSRRGVCLDEDQGAIKAHVADDAATRCTAFPLQALVLGAWAGDDPASWSISQRRAEGEAQQLTPEEFESCVDGCESASWSDMQLTASWSERFQVLPGDGKGDRGDDIGDVATLTLETSEASVGSFAVALSAQSVPIVANGTSLQSLLEAAASGELPAQKGDGDDPYVFIFESVPSERCWHCQGGLLSTHLKSQKSKASSIRSEAPKTISWASGADTTLWIASYMEKSRRCIELGIGEFPNGSFLKDTLKAGPRLRRQRFGLAALAFPLGGESQGAGSESSRKKKADPVFHVKALHVERGLLADRASEQHILHLFWPDEGVDCGMQPAKFFKPKTQRSVAAWLRIEGAGYEYLAVCNSTEGFRTLRIEALLGGWAVACIGDECLRRRAD